MANLYDLVREAKKGTGLELSLREAPGGRWILSFPGTLEGVVADSPPLSEPKMAAFVLGFVAGSTCPSWAIKGDDA